MVYGQVPPAGLRPPGRGGAITVGVLLLAQLLLELIVLAYDLVQAGPMYLMDALGVSYQHFVVAPVGFFGYDTGLCVALVVLAIGAFRGGAWARPAATAVLAVNAYGSTAGLISQFTGENAPITDTPGHLALIAVPVLTLLLAVAVGAVTAATRTRPPGHLAPPYAPYPQPGPFPQQYPLPQPPVLPQPPGTPPTG